VNGPAWATLKEAAEIASDSAGDPQESIRRAVSASLLVRPGTLPLPGREPPALRVRVITQRTIVGNDWLQAPVLDFEKSEIQCRSYMAGTWEEFKHPRETYPARIELWRDDLLRLWLAGPTSHLPGDAARSRVQIPMSRAGQPALAQAPAVAIKKIEAAREGVRACFPEGVPPSTANVMVSRRVGEWLKDKYPGLGTISDDTIERAAGRK